MTSLSLNSLSSLMTAPSLSFNVLRHTSLHSIAMASKSESKAIPSTTLLVTIKKYNNMQGAESMQLDLSRAF